MKQTLFKILVETHLAIIILAVQAQPLHFTYCNILPQNVHDSHLSIFSSSLNALRYLYSSKRLWRGYPVGANINSNLLFSNAILMI